MFSQYLSTKEKCAQLWKQVSKKQAQMLSLILRRSHRSAIALAAFFALFWIHWPMHSQNNVKHVLKGRGPPALKGHSGKVSLTLCHLVIALDNTKLSPVGWTPQPSLQSQTLSLERGTRGGNKTKFIVSWYSNCFLQESLHKSWAYSRPFEWTHLRHRSSRSTKMSNI